MKSSTEFLTELKNFENPKLCKQYREITGKATASYAEVKGLPKLFAKINAALEIT